MGHENVKDAQINGSRADAFRYVDIFRSFGAFGRASGIDETVDYIPPMTTAGKSGPPSVGTYYAAETSLADWIGAKRKLTRRLNGIVTTLAASSSESTDTKLRCVGTAISGVGLSANDSGITDSGYWFVDWYQETAFTSYDPAPTGGTYPFGKMNALGREGAF